VPGGAAGELALLQQQHIGAAHLRQMVGGGTANNAATDDDDLCVTWRTHFEFLVAMNMQALFGAIIASDQIRYVVPFLP
jgi:hypothetical protein